MDRLDIREAGAHDLPVCEDILRSLPDWFGIEESIQEYAAAIRKMPTVAATRNGQVIGFLALHRHNEVTAEIHVMAVREEYHRAGAGSALVAAAERWSREQGCRLLEVKTLGPSHPSEHYQRTRAFYAARGFLPLEELEGLWPGNPCLIMVKVLGAATPEEGPTR